MRHLASLLLAIPLAAQPPAINQEGVRNAASMMPSSMPGAAIARGARFVVLGLRFGPDSQILVSGQPARVFERGPNRMEALMPSTPALGDASLVITNADGASRPFRLRVARSSPGLYQSDVSATPGKTAMITATGIDPQSVLQLFVGGIRAKVGEVQSTNPGNYRVQFQTPLAAPIGCVVPLYVKDTEGHVSNTISIQVHRPGESCGPNSPAWPFTKMPAGGKGALAGLARVELSTTIQGQTERTVGDSAFAAFLSGEVGERPFNSHKLVPPPGACRIETDLWQPSVLPTLPALLVTLGKAAGLSAGSSVTVTGPKGTIELPAVPEAPGIYYSALGGEFPAEARRQPLPLFIGPEKIEMSAPGASIGAFRLTLPALPRLEWLQQERVRTVERARGVSLAWSSAAPVLLIAANIDYASTARAIMICRPPSGSQHFAIPGDAFANFPVTSAEAPVPMGWLGMITLPDADGVPLEAAGLDAGYGITVHMIAQSVRFH